MIEKINNLKNLASLKVYDFRCNTSLLERTLRDVKELDYGNNRLNQQSIVRLNDLDKFSELHDWFQSCIDYVFYDLNLPSSFKKIILTESWVNKNKRGDSHHIHSHPNSYLSAVFYLTTSSSGFTHFQSENMWYSYDHLFDAHYSDCGSFNKFNDFSEQPEAGKLIIFPSKLTHYVESNMSDDVRYTISFNAYPEIHNQRHAVYFNMKVIPYNRNNVDIEE